MTEKEKAFKIALLEKTLRDDFGIETKAQLVEACSKLPPLDIAIFVASVPSSLWATSPRHLEFSAIRDLRKEAEPEQDACPTGK